MKATVGPCRPWQGSAETLRFARRFNLKDQPSPRRVASGHPSAAVSLLEELRAQTLELSSLSRGAAATTCARAWNWRAALDTLRWRGVELDFATYAASTGAAVTCEEWGRALELLVEMAQHGLSHRAASASQWQASMDVLDSAAPAPKNPSCSESWECDPWDLLRREASQLEGGGNQLLAAAVKAAATAHLGDCLGGSRCSDWAPSGSRAGVPKIIHKVLIVDGMGMPSLAPPLKAALQSFQGLNPGHTLRVYSGADCVEYLERHFGPRELSAFHALKPYTYKCDLFRFLVLLREGGYYSDMRQVCLNPFDKLFPNSMEWFSALDELYMHTAFIASVAGHPWLEKVVGRVLDNVEHRFYGESSVDPTGPGAFGLACDLTEKTERWLLGDSRSGCIVSHLGEPVARLKYRKASGEEYGAGEWGKADGGGNNYNDFWHARDVYAEDVVVAPRS